MASINPIYQAYARQANLYASAKRMSGQGKAQTAGEAKDPTLRYGGSATVELSEDGLAALIKHRAAPLREAEESDWAITDGFREEEEALSPKAKELLKRLKQEYGDYDFFAAEKIGDPAAWADKGTKKYSVVFSHAELEKMAADEEYAQEVMDKVEEAIDIAEDLIEEGDLSSGVQLKKLAISFDDDGNMKIFAELEKMSEEQEKRLAETKEKRAEEKERQEKLDEAKEKEKADEERRLREAEDPRRKPLPWEEEPKRLRLTADSPEEFTEQLENIDWESL